MKSWLLFVKISLEREAVHQSKTFFFKDAFCFLKTLPLVYFPLFFFLEKIWDPCNPWEKASPPERHQILSSLSVKKIKDICFAYMRKQHRSWGEGRESRKGVPRGRGKLAGVDYFWGVGGSSVFVPLSSSCGCPKTSSSLLFSSLVSVHGLSLLFLTVVTQKGVLKHLFRSVYISKYIYIYMDIHIFRCAWIYTVYIHIPHIYVYMFSLLHLLYFFFFWIPQSDESEIQVHAYGLCPCVHQLPRYQDCRREQKRQTL